MICAHARCDAQHDKPVKAVRVITSPSQMVVSGSWDRTLRYWDARSPSPVGTVPLSERVYCMDTRENMLAVGCADNFVYVFDTRNPATLVQVRAERALRA